MFLSSSSICFVFSPTGPPKALIKSRPLLTCLLILFCAFAVHARDTIILDRNVEIGWLRIATAHYVFSADDQAPGALQVISNAPDKAYSGYVSCNGKWYAINSEDLFDRDVVLKSENRLFIMIFGGRGASAHISVLPKETQALPPEVTLTAAPDTITRGETAVLSWNTRHADTVMIDPDPGRVPVNGTTRVSPVETSTYTITATGAGGTASADATVTVVSPPSIQIQIPRDGDTVFRSHVTVRGEINTPSGIETGVKVNGAVAMVVGNQFAANHVPVEEGWNTLSAEATDIKGNTAASSVKIFAAPSDRYLWITADRETGIAPFETSIMVGGSSVDTEYLLSHTGPSGVEIRQNTIDKYDIHMPRPGLYFFTAEAADDQSDICLDTIAIAVLDADEVDELCRTKWDGMKTALANGDIEQALAFHQEHRRTEYGKIYHALGADLQVLTQHMREISPVKIDGLQAKYRIKQDHEIDGQNVTVSYYIYFSRDENGIWRIEKY